MDTSSRLKIKIGPHEFEAQGPAEEVRQQFESFKEMVALASSASSPEPAPLLQVIPETKPPQQAPPDTTTHVSPLSKIMRVDGRMVSLTVRPSDVYDAMLLILYGQKELRQNDSVTGSEVMDGLTSTGGFSYVKRVDRYLENAAKDGQVIVIGEHRAKRYRLTNTGYAKAMEVANVYAAIPA